MTATSGRRSRRKVAPWVVVAVAAVLGAGVTVCGCRCHQQQGAPAAAPVVPVAQVVEVAGGVTVTPAGGGATRPASPGPLVRGDVVATDATGRALVALADGRQLEIKDGGRFKVGEASGEITLELQEGILIARAPAGRGDASAVRLVVLTPFGLVRLSDTAGVEVGVTRGGAQIDVSLGEITVVGPDGKEQTAKAGQRIALSLGAIEIVRADQGADKPAAPARVVDLPPVEVFLSAEHGAVLMRRRGEPAYARVKHRTAVEEGTAFRVPSGTAGRLLAGGLDARLAAGASGDVGASARSAEGGEQLDLNLSSGSASMVFRGGQRLTMSGKQGPVVLRSTGRATAVVAGTPAGPRVDVLAGELQVEVGGRAESLRPGRVAELVRGRLHVTPRPKAGLSLPSQRGLHVYTDGLTDVSLTWPEEVREGVVEIASDAKFKHLVAAGRVWGTSLDTAAPARGELHWRVLGADGKVRYHGQARFEPDAGRSALDLANPHSVVKETGLRATVYFQSVPPAITLSWNPQPSVARYRVRVYAASNLRQAAFERIVEDTRCELEPGTLTEGSYVWGATGLTADGREYSGGRMNKLDVVYDNSMKTLAIARPKPGQLLQGSEIDVQGVAPLNSKLTINELAAPLDDKGRFNLKVPRADTLVFRLSGQGGSESYWVRTVKGQP